MSQRTTTSHQLSNGMTVLCEQMPAVQSAALSILFPGGAAFDPFHQSGLSSMVCEMMMRGAGDWDSRALTNRMDSLGLQHSEGVGYFHQSYSGATVASQLEASLELYATILRQPRFEESEFEPSLASCLQTVIGNQDDPRQRLMSELKSRSYPMPFGNPTDGTIDGLKQITLADVKSHYQQVANPGQMVLAVAGNVQSDEVVEYCERYFGDWTATDRLSIDQGGWTRGYHHIEEQTTQTHIALAYPSVVYSHPDYYAAWAMTSILSGGMSSRLFTRVREEKGLCYAISASLNTTRDVSRVLCYAGTTTERAQETLDSTLVELRQIDQGITDDELNRCKARAKSTLIMQQDSSMARSGSLARDWYALDRIVPIEEIRSRIEALTTEQVASYAQRYPAEEMTVVTLGKEALQVAESSSAAS